MFERQFQPSKIITRKSFETWFEIYACSILNNNSHVLFVLPISLPKLPIQGINYIH